MKSWHLTDTGDEKFTFTIYWWRTGRTAVTEINGWPSNLIVLSLMRYVPQKQAQIKTYEAHIYTA